MNGRTVTRSHVVYRWDATTVTPVASARAALVGALAVLGVDGEAREDACLTASELVANATEHAYGPYEVRLAPTGHQWICEVLDHDPRFPVVSALFPAEPVEVSETDRGGGLDALLGLLEERGLGLPIVDYLTKGSWGFRTQGAGKTAWFAVRDSSDVHNKREE